MPSKQKNYKIKFPREIIDESYDVFRSFLGEECKCLIKSFRITKNNETLRLDTEKEFYAEYRSGIKRASLDYVYLCGNGTYRFDFSYNRFEEDDTSIDIELNTMDNIGHVLKIFDEYYTDRLSEIDGSKKNITVYTKKKALPSCLVDINLLTELERYIKKFIEDVGRYDRFNITIETPSGTEDLSSIDDFERSYFPDDTKQIRVRYFTSFNNNILIQFDLDKMFSKMEISLKSESSRQLVERMTSELTDIINSYKRSSYIFHPPGGFFILFPILMMESYIVLVAYRHALPQLWILILILVATLIYMLFGKLHPYIVFRTRKNEIRGRVINSMTFASAEFLIFTVGWWILTRWLQL